MSPPQLMLFNSMGRTIDAFRSATPGKVGMYSCGPTVYDDPHIGNMRAYVFADTLKRVLEWHGYAVDHVINITDVGHLVADADAGDDKVEIAALKQRKTVWELTQHYTDVYMRHIDALNVIRPRVFTKATDFVPQMIDFNEELERAGYTYEIPGLGLYFDTSKMADYGELANLDRDGLAEGASVEKVEGRRNATDFCLWRSFSDDVPRLMSWDTKWGKGAPGWHIECSVMSMAMLGNHFDIHTGGVDHRTLHHINEIAQAEALLRSRGDQVRWVPWWLHNEFLIMRDGKMSKSAGTFVTLDDVIAQGIHPLAYRWFLLAAHYRSQVEFSMDKIAESGVALRRVMERFARAGVTSAVDVVTAQQLIDATADVSLDRDWVAELLGAAANDLATPELVALIADFSRVVDTVPSAYASAMLGAYEWLLGIPFSTLDPATLQVRTTGERDVELVQRLAVERDHARAVKDWARADEIRAQMEAAGFEVRDTPDGTVWS